METRESTQIYNSCFEIRLLPFNKMIFSMCL